MSGYCYGYYYHYYDDYDSYKDYILSICCLIGVCRSQMKQSWTWKAIQCMGGYNHWFAFREVEWDNIGNRSSESILFTMMSMSRYQGNPKWLRIFCCDASPFIWIFKEKKKWKCKEKEM